MQENPPSSDPATSRSDLRPVIDDTLDQLNTRDREMILLRYFEGRTFTVLGEIFHLSEDAARKRTERALKKLRTLLSRRGITSTSAALGIALANQAGAAVAAPAGLAATISASALTTAATAAGGYTGLLSALLMVSSKITTIALIALASAATVGTAVLVKNISGQNEMIAALSAQTTDARTRLDLNRQLAPLEVDLAKTSQALRDIEVKISALPARARNDPILASSLRSAKADVLLAEDPEYVRLRHQRTREGIITAYGEFFDELNLPPAKLDALKEILVTERIDADLARSRARTNGESTASDETKAALRVSTDTALHALLGEQGREAVRRAQAIGPLDDNLAADLSEAGHVLSFEAKRRLARLIYEHIRAPANISAHTSSPDSSLLPSGLTAAETNVISSMGNDFTKRQRELTAAYFKFEHDRFTFEQRISRETP